MLPLGITKGENHEYHFDHSPGALTVGCPAGVALQPKLGIRRQRADRVASAYTHPGCPI